MIALRRGGAALQNLRIKVGTLENQCRRLGREWGESLAALPLVPARK